MKEYALKRERAWNPRYVAFAASQDRTPEAQLEHDRQKFQGGCMVPFILWISEKKRTFRARHPELCIGDAIKDQDAWTRFLQGGKP